MNDSVDLKLGANVLEPGDHVLVRMAPDIPSERVIEHVRQLRDRFPGVEFTILAAEEIHIEPATSLRQLELIALGAQVAATHSWSDEAERCVCGYPSRLSGPKSLAHHVHARHVADKVYRAIAAWSNTKITQDSSE